VSGCVLDTDVVIATLDRKDPHHVAAAHALTAMLSADCPLLLSLVNYAETLVRPATDEALLRIAVNAIAALNARLIAPTRAIAVDAARYRALNISLADGFAVATAKDQGACVATFDRRVRRALPELGLELAAEMT
jgi:predicted nucleic acid-binding protein